MTKRSWKHVERAIAASLGGVRIPVTGRARGDVADVSHTDLSIEVKAWRNLPARVLEAMQQAEAAARDGRLPVAVIHQDHQGFDTSLVVLRLGQFKARFLTTEGRLR